MFGWTPGSEGCAPSAPKGRSNKAQANGLGQKGHPDSGSRALKGRYNPPTRLGRSSAGVPQSYFALSGLEKTNRTDFCTQAVGLGFVRSPLQGSFSRWRRSHPRCPAEHMGNDQALGEEQPGWRREVTPQPSRGGWKERRRGTPPRERAENSQGYSNPGTNVETLDPLPKGEGKTFRASARRYGKANSSSGARSGR